MLTLQSLKGQFSGFHFSILFLKVFKLSISLLSSGSVSHMLGPLTETLALPWYTHFTKDPKNSEIFLSLCRLLFCKKISTMMSGDIFLLTRNISIARDGIFLM